MKRFILPFAFCLSTFISFSQPTVQGTIKKDGNLTIGVYLGVAGGNITGAIANFNLTISIDALGVSNPALAPVAEVTSLNGAAINPMPIEIINGRFVYAFIVTGNVVGGINWVAGSENLVLTATFPESPEVINQVLQLNDFTGNFGGNSGQALFDIGVNGIFYVDYGQMFYGVNATNIEGANSWVEAEAPLPVNLLSFQAEKHGQRHSYLTWSTTNEVNSDFIAVQRSFDNKSWATIGTVKAAGNSINIRTYDFTDENVYNGKDKRLTANYRLQMVDRDGSSKLSPIRSVIFSSDGFTGRDFVVYPNPASEGVQVEWEFEPGAQPVSLDMFDIGGKLVLSQRVADKTDQEYLHFTPGMNPGVYILRIMGENDVLAHKQIVVGQNR